MSHTIRFADTTTFTIYVDSISNKRSPVIAEQQILDTNFTTMQYMGAKSLVKTIQFTFESTVSGSIVLLEEYVRDGYPAFYTDDTGSSGSYVVSEFTHARVQALNKTNPWFRCSMTMTHLPASGSLYYQWTPPGPPR